MLREHRKSLGYLVRRTAWYLAAVLTYGIFGLLDFYERVVRQYVPEWARPTVEFLGAYLPAVLIVAVVVAFFLAFHELRVSESEARTTLAGIEARPEQPRIELGEGPSGVRIYGKHRRDVVQVVTDQWARVAGSSTTAETYRSEGNGPPDPGEPGEAVTA